MNYFLGLISLVFIFIMIYTPKQAVVQSPIELPKVYQEIQPDGDRLFHLTNVWRTENDYPKFIKDEVLCTYARERVEEIKSDWSHDQFMVDKCKTGYTYCAENLSRGYYSEEKILQAWLDSPSHHKNIISDKTHLCIECSDGHCTQQFGKTK